jgi:hypothetical protein
VIPELREWQPRPLDAMYPILYLDAIVVKVRTDGHVRNRPVYIPPPVDGVRTSPSEPREPDPVNLRRVGGDVET